ncbi:MAG TPA: hypothetical protein VGN42_09440, partial [Pirellulales bacterium]|nr:hypothetical protein [Pirellulales bacterium]
MTTANRRFYDGGFAVVAERWGESSFAPAKNDIRTLTLTLSRRERGLDLQGMEKTKVGIVGLGTVGSGVAR